MNVAISLPDTLYKDAERYAQRTQKSRSQLYAEALSEYLARHAPDEATEKMDTVLSQIEDGPSNEFVTRTARRVLENVEW